MISPKQKYIDMIIESEDFPATRGELEEWLSEHLSFLVSTDDVPYNGFTNEILLACLAIFLEQTGTTKLPNLEEDL